MKKITPWWNDLGYFDLSDTDNHVGSLYSIDDLMIILSIPLERYRLFKEILQTDGLLNEEERVSESDLNKTWKCLMRICSQSSPKYSQSLSELELKAVIEKTYGDDISVETQVCVKTQIENYYVDLKATYEDREYYIEFLGPQHFDDEKIEKDKKRNKEIESMFDSNKRSKLIEWPYWIQLCERNVRIAIEEEKLEGRGALWSTKYLWKGVSDLVKHRIIDLSESFNAIHNNSIGYIYESVMDIDGNVIKPEHPIIDKIISNSRYTVDYLLPANVGNEGKQFWLPQKLWDR